MNLAPLFEEQRKLDDHIIETKELQGQDLLDKKVLALLVELGELANEARFFKFWSEDQEPRNKDRVCHACKGQGFFRVPVGSGFYDNEECTYCDGTGIEENNPTLEEYVDCLHFILSIGLEIHFTMDNYEVWKVNNITQQLLEINHHANNIYYGTESDWDMDEIFDEYEELFMGFVGLGEMLGFTWDQIEQAYMSKNKVNHERQENGY